MELALLREAGRNVLGVPQIEILLEGPFLLQPIDLAHAIEFAALDTIADPFDRMIVAAARVAKLPLITSDQLVTELALADTIWD